MGFSLGGLFGGGGGSTSSQQKTEVKNTNNNHVEIHLDDLAKVEEKKLLQTEAWQEYLKDSSETIGSSEKAFKLAQLKQNEIKLKQDQQTLEANQRNSKLTLIIAVVGVILSIWQILKKGKK